LLAEINCPYVFLMQICENKRRCSYIVYVPYGGPRFSAPVQTGPGAHPASYTIVTGSFPGVKRPGRGVDHPSPSRADVKERVELYTSTTPVGLHGLF
jgi:hypothetical protein